MKPLIPVIAVLGLVALAIVPAPGIYGIAVGTLCVVMIIGWLASIVMQAVWAKTGMPIVQAIRAARRRRASRRRIHIGSGVAKKIA